MIKSFQIIIFLAVTFSLPILADEISQSCLLRQEVFNTSTIIHIGASVEPTIAVNPRNKHHIVACWQQDRINNGGALEAGIAVSRNGGKTWKESRVPFQVCDRGIMQRVSDVWLSYSPCGRKIYLVALVLNATTDPRTRKQEGIVISISKNGGDSWSRPRFLASSLNSLNEPTGQFAVDDKPSVTADRNHFRHAYAVWDRFPLATSFHSATYISRTKDSGERWSPAELLYDPFVDLTVHGQSNGIRNDCSTTNNVIVVLPKLDEKSKAWQKDDLTPIDIRNKKRRLSGDLLNFMVRFYANPTATNAQYVNDSFPFQFTVTDIAVVRSKDNGVRWEQDAKVIASFVNNEVFTGGYVYNPAGQIVSGSGTLLRTGNIAPSYAVNPKNGFLYVVWQTGQFRADQLPEIALSRSRDGGHTWTPPVMINRTPQNAPNPQAFTPSVAVTPDGRVGILYFDLRKNTVSQSTETKVDAWLDVYQELREHTGGTTGIGLEFVKEVRLSKKSYIAENGPSTTEGNMVDGDYASLVAVGNHFFAAYTKSLHGPFKAAEAILNDPVNNATLLVDNNYREATFVSVVSNHEHKEKKVVLKSTKRMPNEHIKIKTPLSAASSTEDSNTPKGQTREIEVIAPEIEDAHAPLENT